MSRLRGFVIFCAGFSAVGLLFATLKLAGYRSFGKPEGAVSDPATVDYFSGTTHYAIPAFYRPGITAYFEKRNYSALNLMLFLPDFSPASQHVEEMRVPGWRNRMTLLFEHGPHMISPEAQIAWMTNWPRGVHTPLEPTANGCDLYRTPFIIFGDLYVCPEDGAKLAVSCDRKSDVPSPACAVSENVSTDLSVI